MTNNKIEEARTELARFFDACTDSENDLAAISAKCTPLSQRSQLAYDVLTRANTLIYGMMNSHVKAIAGVGVKLRLMHYRRLTAAILGMFEEEEQLRAAGAR